MIQQDPIFKGATRPAMVFGVPLVPFFIVVCGLVLFSVWFSFFFMILAPIAVFAMRLITEKDDQSFRIIGVSLLLGVRQKHKAYWDGMHSYSAISNKRIEKR